MKHVWRLLCGLAAIAAFVGAVIVVITVILLISMFPFVLIPVLVLSTAYFIGKKILKTDVVEVRLETGIGGQQN